VIEVVFFDAGETILHPHPSFPELFAEVCGRSGYNVESDDVHEVQQRLAPHLVELAEETGIDKPSLSEADSLAFWGHLYRRLLGELGIEDQAVVDELYATFSSSASYKLFADVLPALDAISAAGFRLGLISNFERWLEEMLVELDVGHVFDISVISGIEGVEKPDPEIYRRAVARAGVEPAQCLHVGDSPKMDIEPAAEVGIRGVLLDRYDRYPEVPYDRVASLTELPELLDKLCN
jgi:putative hydrolase of the HAD superfamily